METESWSGALLKHISVLIKPLWSDQRDWTGISIMAQEARAKGPAIARLMSLSPDKDQLELPPGHERPPPPGGGRVPSAAETRARASRHAAAAAASYVIVAGPA